MKERGIIFSAPMVRACLRPDRPKTQTRRLVKGFPATADLIEPHAVHPGEWWPWLEGDRHHSFTSPYGLPGDRLWARENFRLPLRLDGVKPKDACPAVVCYEADRENYSRLGWGKLHPAIHMPRWASRFSLEVAEIRVERLGTISYEDCLAEGWPGPDLSISADPAVHSDAARDWYSDVWDAINGPGSFQRNPWAWTISFRRVG